MVKRICRSPRLHSPEADEGRGSEAAKDGNALWSPLGLNLVAFRGEAPQGRRS